MSKHVTVHGPVAAKVHISDNSKCSGRWAWLLHIQCNSTTAQPASAFNKEKIVTQM